MDKIQEIKMFMKANNITYQQLSDMSGIPLNTIKNIFRGKTQNPRIDTMQAIERALGLSADTKKSPPPGMTESEEQWLELYNLLTEENRELLIQLVGAFKDLPAERRRFVLDAVRLATGQK
jgi:transcriptional regulator with XRE-family HTH domain